MKIVIAGCGIVGTALAEKLSAENHSITVIDISEAKLASITNSLDVLTILGSVTEPDILREANIKGTDIYIAVTDSDDKNLLSCLLAKRLGSKNTIARIRGDQSLKSAEILREEAGLSMAINPEMDAAREIFNSLKYSQVGQVETLAKGTMEILTCTVKDDAPLVGVMIRDVNKFIGAKILICGIKRAGAVFVPKADDSIMAGDVLSFVASFNDTLTFFKKLNYPVGHVDRMTIIGGSKIAVFLARKALEVGIDVKIIDTREEKCRQLLSLVPGASIIHGDGSDTDVLEEEGVLREEVVVTATDDDSTNIMISLYVSKMSPDCRVVTKIKKSDFEELIYNLNVGRVFNSKYITVDHILGYVRAMANSFEDEMESMCHIIENKMEVLEFNIKEGMKNLNKPLKDIRFRSNVLVATIYREGKAFIPGAFDEIKPSDMVIITTTETGISRYNEIFA